MLLSTRRGRFEKIVLPFFFIENDQGMYNQLEKYFKKISAFLN